MPSFFEKIEIVGVSRNSYEDAIQNAIQEVKETFENIRWFEVVEFRGAFDDDHGIQYQVVLKIAGKKGK